jgi:L,D-transpeptidase ErfK/SrfK
VDSRIRAWHWLAILLVPASASLWGATFPLAGADDDLVGEVATTIATREDTLIELARHNDLGYTEIVAANPGVDPWLPGAGTQVVLPTQFILPPGPRRGIVVDLAQMRLFYFQEAKPGEPARVATHPIGIGREYRLPPLGETRVVQKAKNPTWRPPDWVRKEHARDGDVLPSVVPPGPDNPLGEYALYLGMPGYLIHGTNRPWGIGMRVSGGCVRLYPEDIASLYAQVPVDTPVRIVSEPFVLGRRGKALYLKVFPPLGVDADAEPYDLTPVVKAVLANLERGERPDWDAAMRATQRRGVPVKVTRAAR